jgi:hypothetical protein
MAATVAACGSAQSAVTSAHRQAIVPVAAASGQPGASSVKAPAVSHDVAVPNNSACRVLSIPQANGILGHRVEYVHPLASDDTVCYFYSHSLGGGKWQYAADVSLQCGPGGRTAFAVDDLPTTVRITDHLYRAANGYSEFAFPVKGCLISTAVGVDGLTGQVSGSVAAMTSAMKAAA